MALTRLEHLLGLIFDGSRAELRKELDPAEYERRKHDFVFHVTDWQGDLEQLANWSRALNNWMQKPLLRW
jgi:hypothetical protein